MLREKLEMWLADHYLNATFVIIDIYIINLDCLENGPLCFMYLPDGSTEESNRSLVG